METNPYSPPPEASTAPPEVDLAAKDKQPFNLMVAWPVVLVVNLLIPLLFASEILQPQGMVGVILALLSFLLGGWWLCLRWRPIAKRLMAGAAVVALSQFMPILQLIAGVLAIEVGLLFGIVNQMGNNPIGPEVDSILGGWLVTTITGCLLALVALLIGSIIFLFVGLGKRKQTVPG